VVRRERRERRTGGGRRSGYRTKNKKNTRQCGIKKVGKNIIRSILGHDQL